jgi:hypothetical protein
MRAVPMVIRFWEKVNKLGPMHPSLKTRCWVWTACTVHGYGQLGVNGKGKLAHHIAWFLKVGRWPRKHVLHKCDNPACVRYSHLFQGTHTENMQDMMSKGRGHKPKGSRIWCAKLTEVDVQHIRQALKNNTTGRSLAKLYGVSEGAISAIKRNRHWKITRREA